MVHWVVIYNWFRSIDMVEDHPGHRGLAPVLRAIPKIRQCNKCRGHQLKVNLSPLLTKMAW
jgi:hypothetical protein